MPTTATDTIEQLATREYKFGFVTDIEPDTSRPASTRTSSALHLGQEGRAGVAARVAPQGLPPLARR